jgi:peptidoglycan biosynthesis protein MviN/MurJ (putative lipid II flippase)
MDVATPPKRTVNWWMVILGLFIAFVSGAFVGLLAAVGGVTLFERNQALAFTTITLAVALVYVAVWWFTRRPSPDLAIGMLIGGCVMALVSGTCGALLSGLSNMH